MKLLYLMNKINGRGGLNRIAFDKINYLVNHGFSVDVVYFGKSSDRPFYEVDERVRFYNIKIDPLSSFIKKLFSVVTIVFEYRKLLNKINPDIIINLNTNILSWIVPFIDRKTPKIIELHQSYNGVRIFNEKQYGKGNFQDCFSMWLRKTIYPYYDKVIVLTNTDKERWKLSNVMVIPNYTLMKKLCALNYNTKTFLWTGRFSHQKGIDILLDIWKSFIALEPEARLILIGQSNDQYQLLVNEFLQTDIGKTIEYVKETNCMEQYYSSASIYISTSRYEGLPLCLIEASTLGLPIIGFNITGNDEIVKNEVNGILVPSNNKNAFLQAMLTLTNNPSLKKQYGMASLKEANRFQADKIMKKWEDLFSSVSVR